MVVFKNVFDQVVRPRISWKKAACVDRMDCSIENVGIEALFDQGELLITIPHTMVIEKIVKPN